MVLSTAYGIFFAGLGGYLAAGLARRRPLRHAQTVAVLIALGAALSLGTRGKHGIGWSQLAALVFMAPAAVIGGLLRARKQDGHRSHNRGD